MRIFLNILKVIAVVVLVVLVLGTAFYYFGSLKMFEPNSVTAKDGKKIEFDIQPGWCGVQPSLIGLSKMPANSLFVKRGRCKVQDLRKVIKLSELVQVRVNLVSDALQEKQVIAICAKGNMGLSGYKKDDAIYCLANPKDGARTVTVFKDIDNKYIVTTSFFLLQELDREEQLKELEHLVNSYKVRK